MRISIDGRPIFTQTELDAAVAYAQHLFDTFVVQGVRDDPYYPGDHPFVQGLVEAKLSRMIDEEIEKSPGI